MKFNPRQNLRQNSRLIFNKIRYNIAIKDIKNKQIDMLKYWLSILVASFLGIGAYLVTHIEMLQNWLLVVSICALMCLFVAIAIVNLRINRLIDDLKDL